jgi:hypothetical protein
MSNSITNIQSWDDVQLVEDINNGDELFNMEVVEWRRWMKVWRRWMKVRKAEEKVQ